MIRMLVFGQRLYMTASILVSGTQNYQMVKASFYGQEWDGLTRTVHLSKGEDTETLNLSDGSEEDAWTAFGFPILYFSAGYGDGVRYES